MVCDSRELKWAVNDVVKGGYGTMLTSMILSFPTSAERLAEYIHAETMKRIPSGIKLTVTIWETPDSWVEFTDEDL